VGKLKCRLFLDPMEILFGGQLKLIAENIYIHRLFLYCGGSPTSFNLDIFCFLISEKTRVFIDCVLQRKKLI
jgi:hypothetical protein